MKPQTAFVVLIGLTLTSCQSLEGRLFKASGTSGRIAAGIDIGALPAPCKSSVAHAPLIAGQSVIGTLKRERAQLDKANGIIRDCAALHDDLRNRLLGEKP